MLLRKHLAHDPQGPVVLPHRLCPTRNPRCSPGALGGSHQGQQVCCLSADDARCHGSAALGTPLGPVKERAGLCAAAAASACGEAILTSPPASQPLSLHLGVPSGRNRVSVQVGCLGLCEMSRGDLHPQLQSCWAMHWWQQGRAGCRKQSSSVYYHTYIYIYIFHVYTVFSLGLY